MERLKRLYNIAFNTEDYTIYKNIILDIFENNNLNHDLNDSNILNIIALYYGCKIKNYNEMKKYYLMAIKLGNYEAMHNLGNYYQYTEKNYNEMKKYYLMGIECSIDVLIKENYKISNESLQYSMYNLGCYYYDTKNYDEMKKCYLLAIKLNNSDAMIRLRFYYRVHEEYILHYLLRQINSTIAIEKVKQLEEQHNFL